MGNCLSGRKLTLRSEFQSNSLRGERSPKPPKSMHTTPHLSCTAEPTAPWPGLPQGRGRGTPLSLPEQPLLVPTAGQDRATLAGMSPGWEHLEPVLSLSRVPTTPDTAGDRGPAAFSW